MNLVILQVREKGSHFDLMNMPGSRYAELWMSQHKYAGGVPPKEKKDDHARKQLEFFYDDDDSCCRSGGGCNRR